MDKREESEDRKRVGKEGRVKRIGIGRSKEGRSKGGEDVYRVRKEEEDGEGDKTQEGKA